MQNEIKLYDPGIELVQGSVRFPSAQDLLKEAQTLNEHLSTVIVTEDTIATNKKLVAQVRKKADELDNARKLVKKELLKPYEDFEKEVKEIVNTVKEGENMVRDQLNTLEEERRESVRQEIIKLYDLRLKKYPELVKHNIGVTYFLKPKHLNKSTSMDKVEQEMVTFLESTNKDLGVIAKSQYPEEIFVEYFENGGVLNEAIANITERKEREMEVRKVTQPVLSEIYNIIVFRKIDYTVLVDFMTENNIEYKGDK